MKAVEEKAWERSRVEDLELKGEYEPAWRLGTLGLKSNDPLSGCTVLVRLGLRNKAYKKKVLAAMEARLRGGSELDNHNKMLILLNYSMLDGTKPNKEALSDSLNAVTEAEGGGHVPEALKHTAERQMSRDDVGEKMAAFPILLFAAQLGGSEKAWAASICGKQLSGHRERPGILVAIYEAVSGKPYMVTK